MTFLEQITVLILTYNEEANIERTMSALTRFSEVIVLDSGSNDATLKIASRFRNARHVVRPFDTHAAQWNYGLSACGIERPWVLALDADYVMPAALVDEIADLSPDAFVCGYRACFRYCIFGRALRSSLYPPVVVLYRRACTRYVRDGHTQRAIVAGTVKTLSNRIDHDDRKPLSRWLDSQQRYASVEADYLISTTPTGLQRNDRIRLMGWPAPFVVFFYALFVKRCLLDGWPGWLYVLQRTLAETMIAIEIADRRLRDPCPVDKSPSEPA